MSSKYPCPCTAALSTDTATPPTQPAKWRLGRVFVEASLMGAWIAASTVAFVAVARDTDFFVDLLQGSKGGAAACGLVDPIRLHDPERADESACCVCNSLKSTVHSSQRM